MESLLTIGVANVLVAAALAGLAWTAGRLRRPALSHSLWVLVFLKLLAPPLFELRLPGPPRQAPAPAPPAAARPVPPPPAQLNVVVTLPSRAEPAEVRRVFVTEVLTDPTGKPQIVFTEPILPPEAVPPPPIGPASRERERLEAAPVALAHGSHAEAPALDWPTLLLGVWAGGAVLCFGWAALCLYRFERLLRCAVAAPDDLQRQARELARQMGLSRCPDVWLVPGPLPPMVWATLGRARLIFPGDLLERLDAEGRATLLAHELAHVRRGDHWVRRLELLAVGLYWWCPLVWWARRQLQQVEEECCDAWVVSELSPRTYASAILETLDFLAGARPALPPAASGLRRLEGLKRRLTSIMERSHPRHLGRAGGLAVLAGAALLPVLPTVARPVVPAPAEPVPASALPEDLPREDALAFLPRPASVQTLPLSIELATLSPDGKRLALALENHTVQVRDYPTGSLRLTLSGHDDAVTCLAFAPDGQSLASGSPDRTVKLWDLTTGQERRTLTGHTSWVYALAFAPDGRTLASAGYDKVVRLWDFASGQETAALRGHTSSVRGLSFAPDGRTLASAGSDRVVRLWDVDSGRESAVLRGHNGAVRAVLFAPDGQTLASAGADGAVKLWDAAGRLRATMAGHSGEAVLLAFSPKGRTLVSGGLDHVIKVWDVRTTRLRGMLPGHRDALSGIAFTPDGLHLVSTGLDRDVRVWPAVSLRPGSTPLALYAPVDQPRFVQVLTAAQWGVARRTAVPIPGGMMPGGWTEGATGLRVPPRPVEPR